MRRIVSMAGTSTPVIAHSLAEVRLYLVLARCPACGGGPPQPLRAELTRDGTPGVLNVFAACPVCKAVRSWLFEVLGLDSSESIEAMFSAPTEGPTTGGLSVINPTDAPSRAIDLAGWLALHGLFEDHARRATEVAATLQQREAARWLQMRAAACLDEALKFYDADNDLPPEDAFFAEGSREQYRERPDLFAWDRLIELRGRLPR